MDQLQSCCLVTSQLLSNCHVQLDKLCYIIFCGSDYIDDNIVFSNIPKRQEPMK